MKTWHIITCEYSPQLGGVSDYTRLLAQQLKCAGDNVHVWAPAVGIENTDRDDNGVVLHRTFGDFSKQHFDPTETRLNEVDRSFPRTLLVQWVPHGYGRRAMNLPFCRWIERLAKSRNRIELMVHEPYLETQGSWKQQIVARVQRKMIRILLESASRVYMSIPAWERYLRPYAPSDCEMIWLPIPATVPAINAGSATQLVRRRVGQPKLLVGHLGTYSAAMMGVLGPAMLRILTAVPQAKVLLLGLGSQKFADALAAKSPEIRDRILAADALPNEKLSHHLAACDLMLQPFPDGLSSRRTSLMNALAHGLAVVSNSGHLTEELWEQSEVVALAATGTASDLADTCTRLLLDDDMRQRYATAGAALYRERFDWPNVIATLRSRVVTESATTHK